MNSELQNAAWRLSRVGCAPLLAFPAVLSLGLPALAQNVIDTSQSSGVSLDHYIGPVEIETGVSLGSVGGVVVAADFPVQLVNNGQISSASGVGVSLGQGGELVNNGLIHAGSYAVRVEGDVGEVTNTGQISAGYDGVSLNRGGTVSNEGSIFGGHIGVYTGNGLGVVQNSGTISAQSGDAVSLYSGGTLVNAAKGELLGGYSGVYAGGDGAVITNAGLVSGDLFGAYLMGNATVSNHGVLAGGRDGVIDIGQGGRVVNDGVIRGGEDGTRFTKDGGLDNAGTIAGGVDGAVLGLGGRLTNQAGGVISGGVDGVVAGVGSEIVNAGTISGSTGLEVAGSSTIENSGTIIAGMGGDAIRLNGGGSSVILSTGSEVDGAIAGNGTASAVTLTGHGYFSGAITGLQNGMLAVQQNAVWTVSGNWDVGKVVNEGMLTAGLVGAPLIITGDFTQTDTGTLRVVVTPRGMNHLVVSGTAHLAGTLAYVLSPGTYEPSSYDFLTASGGVQGDFADVETSNASQHDRSLINSTASVAVADGKSAALAIAGPLVVAPPDGSLFAAAGQVLTLDSTEAGLALLRRGIGQYDDQGGCADVPAGETGQKNAIVTALAGGFCRMGGWLTVTGGDLSTDGRYDSRGGGFWAGMARAVGRAHLGLAVGYGASNIEDESGGKASLRTIRLGTYGYMPVGRVVISGAVSGGLISMTTTRPTGVGNASGDEHGNIVSAAMQVGMPLFVWGGDVRPAVGMTLSHLAMGNAQEIAASQDLALHLSAFQGTYVAPYMSLTAFKHCTTSSGIEVIPEIEAGLSVNATNPGPDATMEARDGSRFDFSSSRLSLVSGRAGVGLDVKRGQWRIHAHYGAVVSSNWHAQYVQAALLLRF
ncbi:autotransporter outer membrane beta-barrel domain-containing protein [Acidocella sp.]|uniref:autotransporter outer membrane beta-barrel domain-containing protein n=1 Tax=Acidocella sp. TaxID=50710 RepID=UPI003CFCFADE